MAALVPEVGYSVSQSQTAVKSSVKAQMSVGGWSIGTFIDPLVQSCDELAYSKKGKA